MMCFRSLSNIFHPQLYTVKNRWLFCYQVNTFIVKFQSSSSFLEKFLEKSDDNEIINEGSVFRSQHDINRTNRIQCHDKITESLYQLQLKNNERSNNFFPLNRPEVLDICPQKHSLHDWNLHSFDPVYFALKPVPPTPDEIHEVRVDMRIKDDIICKTNCLIAMIPTTHPVFNELFDNEFYYSPLTDFEKQMINMASDSSVMSGMDQTTLNSRPTNTQLECIYRKMSHTLPRFFTQSHDYSMYHQDLIFNNNIRGISTKGISAYVQQLALVRIVGHLKFAHVRFEVLKITKHPDDSTVRVRWRIRGVSGITALKKILKIRPWNWKKLMNEESDWYDGFSTFYVGEDGKIYRHDCDKMMPDDEKTAISNKGLAAKLACLIGVVVQRPVLDDLATILTSLLKPEDMNPKPTVGK